MYNTLTTCKTLVTHTHVCKTSSSSANEAKQLQPAESGMGKSNGSNINQFNYNKSERLNSLEANRVEME